MDTPADGLAPEAPPGNVTRVTSGDKELFIVGTAHVSRQSVAEVRKVVAELRPDSVCVELDRSRLDMLSDESRWRNVDVRDVLGQRRAGLFLASLVFAGFQKRLGDALGVKPGAEMLAAVEAAEGVGAEVVLADREIQATMLRCYRSLGALDRVKVLAVLALLPFTGDLDEAEVEKLKSREAMGDAMEAFARQMPALKVPLIDERDQYLIARTRSAPGKRIVSVVGAAHVPGMIRHLAVPIDTEQLAVLPPPLRGLAIRAAVVPALVLVISGVLMWARQPLAPAFTPLAGLVAGLSAVGAFAGGGAVLSLVVAPLISLASVLFPWPPLDVTRQVGLFEARLRPPGGEDAMNLRADVLSPGRARRNPALRPILVGLAASAGRHAGVAIGLTYALVVACTAVAAALSS
jgi:pheromone shutdown-related protein TraB